MIEVLRPRPGDTVVVSTAAGAVGSTVGQLAALAGCRTVGIAGGPEKVSLCLQESGYDAAIVVCGTASISGWDPPPVGPRVERTLLVRRARMEGLLAFDYLHRLDGAIARLAPPVRGGRLRYREDVLVGIEQAPDAIAGLYRGENLGKRVVALPVER